MSEPLQDFVARFAWRFVPSAREDTQVEAAGAEGEDPAGDVGAGNAGYVPLYDAYGFLSSQG